MPGTQPAAKPDLRCELCPARNHAVCHAVGAAQLHDLAEIMTHRHFKAGDEITHQDETSELFAIIVSGAVKLTRILPDGRQQIVGLLSQSDCLGNVFAAVSHDNVECVTDVELCCFKRSQFEAFFKRHPEVEHSLLQKALHNLDEARQWMIALGRKTAIEKLATFIVWSWGKEHHQCPQGPIPERDRILHLPFSREEIADFLGLTNETVSRNVSKLNASGAIRLIDARTIEIQDIEALQEIAEPPH